MQFSSIYPSWHPLGHTPLTWSHGSLFSQWPLQIPLQFSPKCPSLHSDLKENSTYHLNLICFTVLLLGRAQLELHISGIIVNYVNFWTNIIKSCNIRDFFIKEKSNITMMLVFLIKQIMLHIMCHNLIKSGKDVYYFSFFPYCHLIFFLLVHKFIFFLILIFLFFGCRMYIVSLPQSPTPSLVGVL